jgi:TPR repeat protein
VTSADEASRDPMSSLVSLRSPLTPPSSHLHVGHESLKELLRIARRQLAPPDPDKLINAHRTALAAVRTIVVEALRASDCLVVLDPLGGREHGESDVTSSIRFLVRLWNQTAEDDSDATLSFLERVADEGSGNAMYVLGLLVAATDPAAADCWWRQAAAQGDIAVAFLLGLLRFGRDRRGAGHWWKQVVDVGHDSEAMFLLGLLTVEDDVAAAQRWWRQAAASGHVEAMTDLALLLKKGDPAEAAHWLVRAMFEGSIEARRLLRELLDQNLTLRQMYERSAGRGDLHTRYALAAVLDSTDTHEAWDRAAARLDASAMRALAHTDVELAYRWLVRAAASGDADAMRALGNHFARADTELACRWLERAAVSGDADAMFDLYELHLALDHGPLADQAGPGDHYATAMRWLKDAAAHGSGAAADRLGHDPDTRPAEDNETPMWRRGAAIAALPLAGMAGVGGALHLVPHAPDPGVQGAQEPGLHAATVAQSLDLMSHLVDFVEHEAKPLSGALADLLAQPDRLQRALKSGIVLVKAQRVGATASPSRPASLRPEDFGPDTTPGG